MEGGWIFYGLRQGGGWIFLAYGRGAGFILEMEWKGSKNVIAEHFLNHFDRILIAFDYCFNYFNGQGPYIKHNIVLIWCILVMSNDGPESSKKGLQLSQTYGKVPFLMHAC